MSLERAMINCERCYKLAIPFNPELNYKNDPLYDSRNKALIALESTLNDPDNGVIAKGAIKACLECKFHEPLILYFITNSKHKIENNKK